MDGVLAKLLLFPPHPPPPIPLSDQQYDDGIRQQIDAVRKLSDKSLLQETSGGEDPLDVINPALNSVPYLLILRAHIAGATRAKGEKLDLDRLWLHMVTFLQSFDPRQIRYAGAEFTSILESAAQIARQTMQPAMVIPLIAEALLRVDPYSAVLTSSHLLLAELSIEAEDYVAALPVLEQPVLYLATASANKPEFLCDLTLAPNAYVTTSLGFSSKLKSVDILSYLMLSAMVFIGSRRWDSALRALENVISFPCKDASVSKIMVEAYKKWLLVGLLHTGGLLPLPRSTTPFAIKAYHTIGKPYEAVAALFDAPTAARFRAEIEFASAQWAEDCNVGLMHELLLAYQKWQIRRLSKTYAKMPVSEVVNLTTSAETGTRLALPAVEAMIREMIDENSLRATMTVSETLGPVLHFDAVDAKLPEEELNVALAQATYRVKALTAEIKTTDRALTQHKSYVEHLVKNRNRKNGARSSFDAGMGGMDMDWNQVIDDEDIMNAF